MRKSNAYAAALRDVFTYVPKSVLAAIAVSFAQRLHGVQSVERADMPILAEWQTLYQNGIVPQRPMQFVEGKRVWHHGQTARAQKLKAKSQELGARS